MVYYIGEATRDVEPLVDSTLRDFKEIFPDTDTEELKDYIIVNFGDTDVLGYHHLVAEGTFHFTGAFGAVELFHKNINHHIDGSQNAPYEERFKYVLLHELVHLKHYFNLLDKKPGNPAELIEAYKAAEKLGLIETMDSWWQGTRMRTLGAIYSDTPVGWNCRLSDRPEKEREYLTNMVKDRVKMADTLVEKIIPYFSSRYGEHEKLKQVKNLLSEFMDEWERRFLFTFHPPRPTEPKFIKDPEWKDLLFFDQGISKEKDEKYMSIGEAVAHYVVEAWKYGLKEGIEKLKQNIPERYHNENIAALDSIYRLHWVVASIAGGEQKAVKFIAPEIVKAKHLTHLEHICDYYIRCPEEIRV